MREILEWICCEFPQLKPKVAWNQPMFTDHDTFIIGLSAAKNHFAVAPEQVTIRKFSQEIIIAGYEHTKMLFRIPWEDEVNKDLLKKIIEYNIEEKKNCKTFWRKVEK